jgi:hypothetical protein
LDIRLALIRTTRARRSFDASVDQTDARNVERNLGHMVN